MKGDAVNCGVCRQIVDLTCANCSAMRIAALASELAEARDCGQDAVCAKAPGCQRHWQERNRELASELAVARRMLAEAIDERDAYRDGRYAGPWQPVADHHNGEGYSRAGAAFVGLRRDGRYEWNCAGFKSALVETAAEAKAAADAHLLAEGWFLAGGAFVAGERSS